MKKKSPESYLINNLRAGAHFYTESPAGNMTALAHLTGVKISTKKITAIDSDTEKVIKLLRVSILPQI